MAEEPGAGASELDFFRFPEKELRRRRDLPDKKRVCVIGAGIAGLVASYELALAGHSVLLVEAQDRVGGRIRTWSTHSVNGEFGPMRIPPGHQGSMHYVKELGLMPEPFVHFNERGWLYLRGQRVRRAKWKDLIGAYGDPRELFTRPVYATGRDSEDIFEDSLTAAKELMTTNEWWSVMNGVLGPKANALSNLALFQLISRSFSNSGWELIGQVTSSIREERVSALEACVESIWVDGGARVRPREGMEALPNGLKDRLHLWVKRVDVRLGVRVDEVSCPPGGPVTVRSQGQELRLHDVPEFDYAICAVPAAPSAGIEFQPKLDHLKREALGNIGYLAAAKSLVLVRRRRWELDDGIFGGSSATDLPLQQCWYPSDNADPDPDEVLRSVPEDDIRGDTQQVRRRWVAKDPARSRSPAILTAAYMTGVNAERFASLTRSERTERTLDQLELLHPGIRDDVLDVEHCCWSEQRTPIGGAWTIHTPRTHDRYQDALCRPHPLEAPRVFFAGEHLCVLHGWMQSAIQSALEAAMAVMDA